MQSEETCLDLVDLDRPILFGDSGCIKIEQFSTFKIKTPIVKSEHRAQTNEYYQFYYGAPAFNQHGNMDQQSGSGSDGSPFNEAYPCNGCGYDIHDRFLMKVQADNYHEGCIRCAACHQSLAGSPTCFMKDGQIYCREDHSILFASRCGRCKVALTPTDYVFRSPCHPTYHQQCFTCLYCHAPFSKGDEYLVFEGEIVCRNDYQMLMQAHIHAVQHQNPFDFDHGDPSRKTPKRPRTILNATQRRQFKAAFEKSAKPCRKVREQLAKETSLSVRVVQVWFQNQRAKMKKMQRKEDTKRVPTSGSDGKTEDNKSSSDEEGDSDMEENDAPRPKGSLTDLDIGNPIEKLYHMQNFYFPPT